MGRVIRVLIFLPIALASSTARALEVSDAEYLHAAHMDAIFKRDLPGEAMILEISTGNSYEISAVLPAPARPGPDKKIGMTYSADFDATTVTAKPAEFLLSTAQCREPKVTPAQFSFITALNVKQQAARIAVALNLPGVVSTSSRLLTDGNCRSYWQQRIDMADDSEQLALLQFDLSGNLQVLERFEKNQLVKLSDTEIAALRDATQIRAERTQARVTARAEAEELPAFPTQGEYLQMQIDGMPWHCVGDDMELTYDYFQLEFECTADAGNQRFGYTVSIPVAGELRNENSVDGGLTIWWRQGDLLYAGRHDEDHFSLRLTSFTAKEISGEFSADLHLLQLPAVRLHAGRFRILPSAGFRITPP